MITDFLGLRKEFVPLSSVAYVSLSVKKKLDRDNDPLQSTSSSPSSSWCALRSYS